VADGEANRAAVRAARESYGRILAYLTARTRDVAGAEDALSEAFTAALRTWPVTGVPDNPDAWLLTAARRKQTDSAQRERTRRLGEEHVKLIAEELTSVSVERDNVPDRRLALMFACAHPAIDRGMRTPLILQTILGLTCEGIASAFLISPATMAQRLVRAKLRIRDAGIPFRVPEPAEMAERLGAVLDAIYAAYTRGWDEVGDDSISAFSEEAQWLGSLIVSLLPEEPEARGMLALILYTSARSAARRNAANAYVPFEEQDPSLWDHSKLALAERLMHEANAKGPTGRYQLEAAIQSAHVARRLTGKANFQVIVALYNHLHALTGSPVAILNRAVARAQVDGPHAALTDLMALRTDKRMQSYQAYWAAMGHLHALAGDACQAREAMTVAIGLSTDDAVKSYLRCRISMLQANGE